MISRPAGTVREAIGNTPVVQLQRLTQPDSADVYVKLEGCNPTGSYKDRMALAMIEEAEKREELRPGMSVVEYTGGSTGSSLAFVCAMKGYRFRVVSSDAFAAEKLDTMLALGAELTIVPSDGGKITPDLVPRMIAKAEELVAEGNAYFTNQLHNKDMIVGYRKVGEELSQQVEGNIDVFCAAVGTGGLLSGVAEALEGTRIVALEPAESAVLSGGEAGTHGVEGIGIGFRPPLLRDETYHEVRSIPEAVGRDTTRRLAREEGIFVGISSGVNVAAALQLAQELGPGGIVATVAADTGLKYLRGDLFA